MLTTKCAFRTTLSDTVTQLWVILAAPCAVLTTMWATSTTLRVMLITMWATPTTLRVMLTTMWAILTTKCAVLPTQWAVFTTMWAILNLVLYSVHCRLYLLHLLSTKSHTVPDSQSSMLFAQLIPNVSSETKTRASPHNIPSRQPNNAYGIQPYQHLR